MNKQFGKGICLREQECSNVKGTGWIIRCFSAMTAFFALANLLVELTGFYKICNLPALLLLGFSVCLLYAITWRFQKEGFFCLGTLILLLLFTLLFRTQIMEGGLLFWNQLADTWTANTGWVVQEVELQLPEQDHTLCLVLFSALIGLLGTIGCCVLSFYAASAFAVALPVLLIAGMVGFHSFVSPTAIVFVLSASVFLLCGSGKDKRSGIPTSAGWILCGISACALLAVISKPDIQMWAEGVSQQVHQMIHCYQYETEYTTLPEGDFSSGVEENNRLSPALVVTMTHPEAMYLRGFTGCTFTENAWTEQDTSLLAENKELLYWLNLNEFHPSAQFAEAVTDTQVQTNVITVENIGACSRYLYVPFSLQKGEYLVSENLKTDSVVSQGGHRTYTYSAVSGGEKLIYQLLEQMQMIDTEEEAQFLRAETAYRDYVYANYMDISPEMKELMEESWKSVIAELGYTDDLTMEQAQKCILAFLEQSFPENGTQPVEGLPLKNLAGTNYQYATVAVLTLRYFGIPARYAEGYQITEEMIAQAGNSTSIMVDSSKGQAWAEVYLEGVGWIPMSLMPGFDAANGLNGSQYAKQPEMTQPEPELETPQEEPEAEMSPQREMLSWNLILCLLLLILLAILAMIVRRRLLLYRKEKRFHNKDRKEAIAWVFSEIALLLKQMEYDRGNGSMLSLCGQIKADFGEEYEQELMKMIELNGRALFSSCDLDQNQWEQMMRFYNRTLTELKEKNNLGKRLWMQWGMCLY